MSTQRLGEISQVIAAANGAPTYLGTITATTTKNNTDTAVPFNTTGDALKGKILLLQASATCYILPGLTSTVTVTTGTGVKLAADDRVIITMTSLHGWLAVVGSADVKVWELN